MTGNKKLQHQLNVTICLGNQIWSYDDEHVSNESLKTHNQHTRMINFFNFCVSQSLTSWSISLIFSITTCCFDYNPSKFMNSINHAILIRWTVMFLERSSECCWWGGKVILTETDWDSSVDWLKSPGGAGNCRESGQEYPDILAVSNIRFR